LRATILRHGSGGTESTPILAGLNCRYSTNEPCGCLVAACRAGLKPLPDDPAESMRFIDMVREVGAEDPSPDFQGVFRKIAEQPKGTPSSSERHNIFTKPESP
jgi:hypothetical protein